MGIMNVKIQFFVLVSLLLLKENWTCHQLYDHSLKTFTITCINIVSLSELEIIQVQAEHIELKITNSSIATLPPSTFLPLFNITKLSMNYVQLTTILPGAFDGLHQLEELHLDNNNLKEINTGTYNHLHDLKILNLTNNHIRFVQRDSLSGLYSLRELHLRNNKLTNIETYMFERLLQLKLLDLSENPLKKFCTTNLKNLTSLYLSKTMISNVDTEFCGSVLSNITTLTISHGDLESLKDLTMVKSTKVKDLDFSFNKIANVSKNTFRHFKSLLKLNLERNNITELVPGVFFDLITLITLDLSHNQIEHFLCGTFDNLADLMNLDISYNKLTRLEPYIFQSMYDLRKLYINNNQISSFNIEYFLNHLRKLETISLNYNPWKCADLVSIYRAFNNRKVFLLNANQHDEENYFGIVCTSQERDSDELSTEEVFKNLKMKSFFDRDLLRSKFFQYFNKDFKKSNFFKEMNRFVIEDGGQNLDHSKLGFFSEQVVEDSSKKMYIFIVILQIMNTVLLLFVLLNLIKRIT